jgi:chemotaxis protein methyltransferase CheR
VTTAVRPGEATLTDKEFAALRELIYAHTGIALAPYKRYLVQARLGRRLRALGLSSFAEYHERLVSGDGAELTQFINAMTTNKTDFFREAHHFEYLRNTWLPARRAAGARKLRIWSAACSTGEEPYTIAVTVLDALDGAAGWDVKILASDIDTDVLGRAEAGTYSLDQVAPVPAPLLARYFQRGRGQHEGSVRVSPALRSLVTFRRINFLDDPWPIRATFDAIFCRNVLIYFDRPTQQRLLTRLLGYLAADGVIFLGHSESAFGLVAGLSPVGATVYRRTAAASSPAPAGRLRE